jgi:hypothetical protein
MREILSSFFLTLSIVVGYLLVQMIRVKIVQRRKTRYGERAIGSCLRARVAPKSN